MGGSKFDVLKLAREAWAETSPGIPLEPDIHCRAWLQRFADLVLEAGADKIAAAAAEPYTWGSENSDRYHSHREGLLRAEKILRAMKGAGNG